LKDAFQPVRPMMKKTTKLCSIILISLLLILLNPSLPQKEKKVGEGFSLFSEEQELEMGKDFSKKVEAESNMLDTPLINSYVDSLGQRLASLSERNDIPYQFKVIDTEKVNAFALPGGYVYLNRGMLEMVENESELAAVIGHEIGHIAARHGVRQLSKRLLFAGIIIGTTALISKKSKKWGEVTKIAGSLGMFIGMMKYSRDDERQADHLGLMNMHRAGFNPEGMVLLFEKFEKLHNKEPSKIENIFSTHPPPSERIANTKKELADLDYAGRSFTISPDFSLMKEELKRLSSTRKESGAEEGKTKKLFEIKLPAHILWTDTEIWLKVDDYIILSAEGEIRLGGQVTATPEGADKKSIFAPLGDKGLGALIGKLGEEGVPFYIGNKAEGRVERGGRLYLGINDSVHNDNRESYLVKITIIRKSN
jgi:predicted Zn-dependent protease